MSHDHYAASLSGVTFEEGLKDNILAYLSVYDVKKKNHLWSRLAFLLGFVGVIVLYALGKRRTHGS